MSLCRPINILGLLLCRLYRRKVRGGDRKQYAYLGSPLGVIDCIDLPLKPFHNPFHYSQSQARSLIFGGEEGYKSI